jgi:ribose-phosphate pyrophosphokinase
LAIVVSGSRAHSRLLGELLASRLNMRFTVVEGKRFPDGELYVRVTSSVKGEDVIVVQSMEPPQNDALVELMLLVDALVEAGAGDITLFAPYLPYARQDRVFLAGEPVSVRAILKTLHGLGVRRLVVVEAHSERALSYFPGHVVNVNPLPYMAKLSGLKGDVLVVSPDLGGISRARGVAEALGARSSYIAKVRDRVTGSISMDAGSLDPRGLDVVVVDDILSTGGTLAEASRILLERGARSVQVIVVHNLNLPGALERVLGAGVSRITTSNTLPQPDHQALKVIDVTPLVAGEIAKWVS